MKNLTTALILAATLLAGQFASAEIRDVSTKDKMRYITKVMIYVTRAAGENKIGKVTIPDFYEVTKIGFNEDPNLEMIIRFESRFADHKPICVGITHFVVDKYIEADVVSCQ